MPDVPERMVVATNGGETVTYIREDLVANEDEVLRAELALWKGRFDHAEEVHQDFRRQVRDLALRVKEEQNWCDSGFNHVMIQLGLEPLTRSYRATVRVYAFQDVEVEIEATSEDEAREIVLQDDRMEQIWGSHGPGDGVISPEGWDSDSLNVEDPKVIDVVQLAS